MSSHQCHLPGCRICAADEQYRRDMAKIYNENCDMCRRAGVDRKMTHFDDHYGNMCDEHFERIVHSNTYAQVCGCGFAYDQRDRAAHLAEVRGL